MVKVTVIGCGLMGVKIGGEFAYHGHTVKMYDNDKAKLDTCYTRMQEDKQELRDDGLLLQENFIGRVLCLSHLEEALKDAQLVFETISEDLSAKQSLMERVSQYCNPLAILATSTLSLDTNKIFERIAYKTRGVGVRFLFPVYYIPEVEVTPTQQTSTETIHRVRDVLERMGKTVFFRSGSDPLILSEEQRESRKKVRLKFLRKQHGLASVQTSAVPFLSNRANVSNLHENDQMGSSGVGSETDRDCAICMDRNKNCLLRPCCHMCTCVECGKLLLNRKDGCPICRKDIKEIIRIFQS